MLKSILVTKKVLLNVLGNYLSEVYMDEKVKRYLLAGGLVFVFLSFVASLGTWASIIMSAIAGWQIGEWSLIISDKLLKKT